MKMVSALSLVMLTGKRLWDDDCRVLQERKRKYDSMTLYTAQIHSNIKAKDPYEFAITQGIYCLHIAHKLLFNTLFEAELQTTLR